MESPDDPRLWGFRTLAPGPNWNLLRHLLGDHLASFFRWTNAIDLLDNGIAHSYRHAATGRFLEIHEDGTTLEYLGGSDYAAAHPSHAIASAFAAWESHGPQDHSDQTIRELRRLHDDLAAAHGPPFEPWPEELSVPFPVDSKGIR